MNILRNTLAVAAASALLALTAACGGGDKAAVCQDAIKAFTDYSSKAGASAGNLEAINTATADLASTLKSLSGKADGDLKTALTGMADSWANFKLDVSDPAAATKMTEFATKATQATQQLGTACS
ncbi:hypothetical protein N5079_02110 [Planotetraspora sp. A-T 1434]|uniref:hypothetical protein n=1 Tax=Planotetraspora sp. A-T 1434 TaxID=2979219 RepID=UPI0021C0FE0F|nr:hypothetical protein [Planotetraspora sp. A-T 1434]MCT9929007.1 hypothetical protein [Planotetraspora sp. A-T 1434]